MNRPSFTSMAHPNIALAKYWGKSNLGWNIPSVPSISVTLTGMKTVTKVIVEENLTQDVFELNGVRVEGRALSRVQVLLDRVRKESKNKRFARVQSSNDFPTSSGLASSASGFAALSHAAVHAYYLHWELDAVSDLSRKISVSSARSVFGGFVELENSNTSFLSAKQFASENHWDLSVIVAVTTEREKEVGSSEGMILTQKTSPFFPSWVQDAHQMFLEIKESILSKDFERLAPLVEQSSMRMHACAMAATPFLLYWNSATIDVIRTVQNLRKKGFPVCFTIDAGPHVKILTEGETSEVKSIIENIPGVQRTLLTKPGPGVQTVDTKSETAL